MTQTIKYIGTQDRWPELAVTGKQTRWLRGQTDERSDAEAALLLATGLFEGLIYPAAADPVSGRVFALDGGEPSPVSGAGNAARYASKTATQILDDYQDSTPYTITGGTKSTVAAPYVGGGRVAALSAAGSQAAMPVSRTIPYAVTPSKLGRIAVGVHQTGTKSGLQLKLGTDAAVVQVDSHTTPIRDQGVCHYLWHGSEFPTTFATTTPTTFDMVLQMNNGGSGHVADTTLVLGPVRFGMTHVPSIVFTVDDCAEETYTVLLPLFRSFGIVGSVMVVANDVGTPGRLTWAMIQELANAGWAINVNATPDDTSMSTDAATAIAALRVGQQALIDQGVARNGGESIICYPNNASTAAVRAALRRYGVTLARTTNPHGIADLYGLGDQGLYIPSYSLSSGTVLANAQARLAQAMLRGETQFIHMHKPVAGNPAGNEVAIPLLTQILQDAVAYQSAGTAVIHNTTDYVAVNSTRSAPAIV